MKIIIVPDEGEWVLVPKVATDATLNAAREAIWQSQGIQLAKEDYKLMHAAILATAPPCKVVELPARLPIKRSLSDYGQGYIDGHDDCLDEIERRAK